jgi:Flp pilus assembly protein TadD
MNEPRRAESFTHRATASGARPSIVVPLLVAALTFVAFAPALQNDFVAWDDDKNFLGNPHYRGLGATQLRWMWTTFHLGHYVPLSWMTLGLDHLIWGMNPLGYHLTNIVLHCANAVLVYFLARRLLSLAGAFATESSEGSRALPSAFAALVFAVHPLRVESVAWVTERRDVLSELFYLSTLLLYLRAITDPSRFWRSYSLAVAAFACALLSKATAVTLPAVLAIINVYPLKRLDVRVLVPRSVGTVSDRVTGPAGSPLIEILPFAIMAAAVGLLSIVVLHPPGQLSAGAKVAVSAYSLVFYLWKTIAPVGLSPIYEMPQHVDPIAGRFVASYVVVAMLVIAAWIVRRRQPGVVAAALAFLVIVFPLLGVVQNGPQIAADRYTYHAAPALALLAGAGLSRLPSRGGIALAAALVLPGMAMTWNQTRVWHDTKTLWSRVLQLDDESSVGHVGMANVLFKEARVDDALAHARRAVAIAPTYAQARNDLGVGLARTGQLAEAANEYRQALALEPANDEARSNLGVLLAARGDLAGAIEQYRIALDANADNADAHVNWGNALVRLTRSDEAITHYRAALYIRPDHADAEHNWGVALARSNRLPDAIVHFRRALAIDPSHAEAKEYLERATQLLRSR